MWQIGDKVWYWFRDDAGEKEKIAATVIGTFYEPDGPIQGVDILLEDGRIKCGLDSQDCSVREEMC